MLPAMHLRQLEYLSALARERHFARAATACHVSQPALSDGIRRLEAELGVQIVRRSRSFEGFTPEGERVVHWARRILADSDELLGELSRMRSGLSGSLRIGAIPTALTVSSLITEPFLERHPQVRISIESLSSRDIVTQLNDFTCDVGITYVDGEPLGSSVRTVNLYQEQYLLLTPSDSPLASLSVASWNQVATLPLCLLGPVMQNRRILDQQFADAGVDVEPSLEADTVSVLYAHVATRRWSTVIAQAWLHLFGVPDGMRAIPLHPLERPHHVGLVLADHEPQPMLAQAFVDVASQVDVAGTLGGLVEQHLAGREHRPLQ